MNGIEYQSLAMRTNDGKATTRLLDKTLSDITKNISQKDTGTILNACLGLSGEVGEFNDMIKKWIFHEKELDEEHLKKECGDIMWYIAMMCHAFGWDLDDIMGMNIEKLKSVVKYVELNYASPMTIAQMADLAGFSESHFMKYFKNTMGTSFIDYLNEYRLTMASRLLISSDSSVLDIAAEVGFDNLSYFNRSFKKRFQQTPREYRKRYAQP